MNDGKVEGYFLLGQNPAVGSAHGKLQRLGMAQLKWLVVRDLNLIESATFWKDGPEIATGELVTRDIGSDGMNFLGSSYDNTGALGASTWRHVAFIEQPKIDVLGTNLGHVDLQPPTGLAALALLAGAGIAVAGGAQ